MENIIGPGAAGDYQTRGYRWSVGANALWAGAASCTQATGLAMSILKESDLVTDYR